MEDENNGGFEMQTEIEIPTELIMPFSGRVRLQAQLFGESFCY